MFDLSPEKLLFIGIIALLVLGPDKLPGAARSLGRLVHQLRSMSSNLQGEMGDALAEPRKIFDEAVGDMGLSSIPRVPNVRQAVTNAILSNGDEAGATAGSTASTPGGAGAAEPVPDDPTLN